MRLNKPSKIIILFLNPEVQIAIV